MGSSRFFEILRVIFIFLYNIDHVKRKDYLKILSLYYYIYLYIIYHIYIYKIIYNNIHNNNIYNIISLYYYCYISRNFSQIIKFLLIETNMWDWNIKIRKKLDGTNFDVTEPTNHIVHRVYKEIHILLLTSPRQFYSEIIAKNDYTRMTWQCMMMYTRKRTVQTW